MKFGDIAARAERILFDNTNVRWPLSELLDYTNDAQKAVVLLRPDANAVNETLRLMGGTRQEIPAAGIRLLRVIRNRAGITSTDAAGRAVRLVSREALDSEKPDWHVEQASTTIQHYVHDPMDPRRFYVYPPAPGTNGQPSNPGAHVELVYSSNPVDIPPIGPGFNADQARNVNLTLGDQYLSPVLDWVLYRCYSKDASYAGNAQRAATHLQNFANALQVTMTIAMTVAQTPSSALPVPPPGAP